MPCLNEARIGGFSTCRAPIRLIDMCPYPCKYYIEDEIEELYRSKDYMNCLKQFYKPSWNEKRHRCYEGTPIDKKIPNPHKDEWDWKQYWQEEYKNYMIKWFGPIWCIQQGII